MNRLPTDKQVIAALGGRIADVTKEHRLAVQALEAAQVRISKLEKIHDLACDVLTDAYEPYALRISPGRVAVRASVLEKLGNAIKAAALTSPTEVKSER